MKNTRPNSASFSIPVERPGKANLAVAVGNNPRPGEKRVSFSEPLVIGSCASKPVTNAHLLWNRVERDTSNVTDDYLDAANVESHDSGSRCVAHSAKKVTVNGKECTVPANEIRIVNTLVMPSGPIEHLSYVCAQSPQSWSECEKMLMLGIDSRLGLFQFTSSATAQPLKGPNSEVASPGNSLGSVIEQLLAKKTEMDELYAPCVLGNRFQVTHIACEAKGSDFSRFLINVQSPGAAEKMIIPMTVACMNLDQGILLEPEIERAKTLLDDHNRAVSACGGDIKGTATIISDTGLGRSAALIVYQELSRKIERGVITLASDLDRELKEFILHARRACGPGFLHSAKQLAALKASLEDKRQQCTDEFKKINRR